MTTKTILTFSIAAVLVAAVGSVIFAENYSLEAEAAKPSGLTERVSVTTELSNSGPGVTVLLDTTGSGTLGTVHVAASLPCDATGAPAGGLAVVAGIAGVSIPPGIPVVTSAAENTGFPGMGAGLCVFHNTVTAPAPGSITDVVVVNGILPGQSTVGFPPGTTITVTGTYE